MNISMANRVSIEFLLEPKLRSGSWLKHRQHRMALPSTQNRCVKFKTKLVLE